MAVTGFIGALSVSHVAGGRLRLGPRPATAGAAVRYSAVNYLSTLGYQAPYFALPVIVLANVTARVNASFYVAWGIVAVAFYVPSAIGQALLAEGGKDGVNVETQLRLAMLLAGGLMLLGTVATFVGSGLVTVVYGAQYRDAARILPAMMARGHPVGHHLALPHRGPRAAPPCLHGGHHPHAHRRHRHPGARPGARRRHLRRAPTPG